MANLKRLQFVKHEDVFPTREEAVNYVLGIQAIDRPSLFGEPMALLYGENENPYVILAIGSVGDGITPSNSNRTFFIDTQKTEEEIEELWEYVEEAVKSLAIIPLTSDTISLTSDKTPNGTFLSGDVKIADYRIIDGTVVNNIIETEGNKGIYTFVDMDYNPETFVITFKTTKTTKEFQLPTDQHVVNGWYSIHDEAIYLKLADNTKVKIDVVPLIDEWTVLRDNSSTPICLYKDHVSSSTETHDGVYDWQDILTADVRVASHIEDNILEKDGTGKYLYVKGTADNITYDDGKTVKQAIDEKDVRVSTSTGNLIYRRADGIYAYAMLDYKPAENKLVYKYTDGVSESLNEVEFALNSIQIIDDISYDPVKEVIIIRYIDANKEYKTVEIPVRGIIEEWDVENNGHSVTLVKHSSPGQGKDILTADVKKYDYKEDNNILEVVHDRLYVNGVAKNIKYDVTGSTTVKDAIDNEIERSISADTVHDGRLDAIDAEIGDGFGPRNTVRDEIENLQSEIDAVSADSASSIKDVINTDHSIDVDKTNATKPVIKVNLSAEVEDNKPNIIKLNNDGLYAGVDLIYDFDPDNGKNDLIFKTTNGSKTIELKTASVVDKIYYDQSREAIIIEYSINGRRMPDVVVPVGDLINEWRVEDGHPNAVQLEKVRESGATQDVLKASVVITDSHDDNILVMDNGTLYVSNSGITANAAAIESLEGRMDTAEADIDTLGRRIDQEIEDRVDDVDAEQARAEAAELALSGKIDTDILTEKNRAISAETALSNKIDADVLAERNRAVSAETDLQTEIETVSADSLNSIKNIVCEDGSLYVDGRDKSNVTISVRIDPHHDDNTLVNHENDGLYVPANNDVTRALSGAIDDERDRAISAETALDDRLEREIARATSAETALDDRLGQEIARATSAETVLDTKINAEEARAKAAESALTDALNAEIARSTEKDAEHDNRIDAVSSNTIASLKAIIAGDKSISAVTTDVDTPEKGKNVTLSVVLSKNSMSGMTNNIKLDTSDNGGLYSVVDLEYQPVTNTLTFKTTNGNKEIPLLGSSILNDVYYDADKEAIIIKYTVNEEEKIMEVPVRDLIDEWTVEYGHPNAIQLEKIRNSGGTTGSKDVLVAKAIVSSADDNILGIKDGALYVSDKKINCVKDEIKVFEKAVIGHIITEECGSGYTYEPNEYTNYISAATSFTNADIILDQNLKNAKDSIESVSATSECTKNELKVFETAVIGNVIPEECGSGYKYVPNEYTNYISAATSFNNADIILDQNLKNAKDNISTLSGKTECVDSKANKIYELLNGVGTSMPDCGSGTTYTPDLGSCVISAATSFMEADRMLGDQICEILEMWQSGMTCTSISNWIDDGANKRLEVDVRPSYGNSMSGMTNEDLYITNLTGKTIEHGVHEFTDTNALRIVCLQEGGGVIPDVKSTQNGVYLSNVWNCGKYYQQSTEADEMAEVSNDGYNVNYFTDEDSSSANYDYNNNVRQ